jgi:hypothetical protein
MAVTQSEFLDRVLMCSDVTRVQMSHTRNSILLQLEDGCLIFHIKELAHSSVIGVCMLIPTPATPVILDTF